MTSPTADAFIAALWANQSDIELEKIGRYFKSGKGDYGEGDRFIGVRMGTVFQLAKQFVAMAPGENRDAAGERHPRGAGRRRLHHGQAIWPQENQR